jgi:NifU-like protein
MSTDVFYTPYPWVFYTKKMVKKIENPQFVGFLRPEDIVDKNFRLVLGEEGSKSAGAYIVLYWLVDELDGVIADVRYQVYGSSALIAVVEAACELLLRKNHDQARRFSGDMIERQLKDRSDEEAVSQELYPYLNLVIAAIEAACDRCTDIPFEEFFANTEAFATFDSAEEYPDWILLDEKKKLEIIEEIIQREIRPYVELDAGGIQAVDISKEDVVTIAYSGACNSCYSATGSTLHAVEQILQTRIYPKIQVTVDVSFFNKGLDL